MVLRSRSACALTRIAAGAQRPNKCCFVAFVAPSFFFVMNETTLICADVGDRT